MKEVVLLVVGIKYRLRLHEALDVVVGEIVGGMCKEFKGWIGSELGSIGEWERKERRISRMSTRSFSG